jgi:hypothetical protein
MNHRLRQLRGIALKERNEATRITRLLWSATLSDDDRAKLEQLRDEALKIAEDAERQIRELES